jgi:hypothetical protein
MTNETSTNSHIYQTLARINKDNLFPSSASRSIIELHQQTVCSCTCKNCHREELAGIASSTNTSNTLSPLLKF